jgi:outer membrane biosynthesis protein TonB
MRRSSIPLIGPSFLLSLVLLAAFGGSVSGADESKFKRDGAPVYSGVGGVINPELDPASKVQPAYPEKARLAHVEAKCVLQPVILKDGTIGPLEVLECNLRFKDGSNRFDAWPRQKDEYGFAQSAFDAVKQWRYKPATLKGEAVDAWFTVVVTYELN